MKTYLTDVLVVGGGGAGLIAAITARRAGKRVILVSKFGPGVAACTTVSAAAFSSSTEFRSKEAHHKDTMRAGQGLNQSSLVDHLVENAAAAFGSLAEMGVPLEANRAGYAAKSNNPFARGTALVLPLREYAQKIGVEFTHPCLVWELLIKDNQVFGAWGFDQKSEEPLLFLAPSVILASGGGAAIYARTNNPASICGDGYAIGARAGLPLIDMEFVQFYPLMSDFGPDRTNYFLIPVTGEPCRFVNNSGEDLVKKYEILRPIAIRSRDLTSRVMALEKSTYLDFSETTEEDWRKAGEKSNPASTVLIKEWLATHLFKEAKRIPVNPAAHFICGGIAINDRTKTAVAGLFAAGEVTGGLHGANRLGGNALSETVVFGRQAGLAAAAFEGCSISEVLGESLKSEAESKAKILWEEAAHGVCHPAEARRILSSILWDKVGILRDKDGLKQALDRISVLKSWKLSRKEAGIAKTLEVKNMLLVAEMITVSALFREESRGCHYRLDFPEKNDANWLCHTRLSLSAGQICLEKNPAI